MGDYYYYGLRLRTDLPLTGLPPWPGPAGDADVEIVQGAVPAQLAQAVWSRPYMAVDAAGTLLMVFKRFRLLAENGRRVRIMPIAADVTLAEIEGWLLSLVAGVVLHQRGILPLHASAVVVGTGAIAFTAPSGHGKSTLAAMLSRRGHRLISDDVAVIRFDDAEKALVVPGSPHLRLTAASLDALGAPVSATLPGRPFDDKRIIAGHLHPPRPVLLKALVRLEFSNGDDSAPCLTRLSGAAAILPIQDLVYRFALGRRLGQADSLAAQCLRLGAAVPIYRLRRPRDLGALDATQETIAALA